MIPLQQIHHYELDGKERECVQRVPVTIPFNPTKFPFLVPGSSIEAPVIPHRELNLWTSYYGTESVTVHFSPTLVSFVGISLFFPLTLIVTLLSATEKKTMIEYKVTYMVVPSKPSNPFPSHLRGSKSTVRKIKLYVIQENSKPAQSY